MPKYSLEIAISVETDATDLDDATDTAENLMAELHNLIRNSQYQGWVNLIEVIDLGEEN